MASEAYWAHADFAEWADGSRRMTGPGLVFFDESGRVTRVGPEPIAPPDETAGNHAISDPKPERVEAAPAPGPISG